MSLVVTTDVECDAPRCLRWTDGVVIHSRTDARDARKSARVLGWRCDRTGDWCPDHKEDATGLTPNAKQAPTP